MTEAWVDFVAGWASGAMSVWTCQPVDTVLTRLQAGALRRDVLLKNTKGLVESAGVTSLWRGSSVMISAVPMQNAMLMGGYGIGKEWSEKHNSKKIWPVFIGGCTGGVLQSFLMAPVELVKVHQQLTSACVKTGIQFWGNAAKWRGLHATLWRDGIPHGVWFASYEWCKTTLADSLQAEKESPTEQVTIPLTSGAFAATVAWVVGYPFDIIKTRIQASPVPKEIFPTAMELVKEANGVSGLYKGFGLKLVRAIPASMVGFTTYEFVSAQIRKQQQA